MNRVILAVTVAVSLLGAGCDSATRQPEIPPQQYATALELLGTASGGLVGRIVFPDDYNQRSTPFHLNEREFVTNPDGRFWIKGIPTGQHELRVQLKGYEPVRRDVVIEPGTIRTESGVQLAEARGQVMGRLLTDAGHAAGGVTLQLGPEEVMLRTQPDGSFQFLGVGAGKHVLEVRDRDFVPHEQVFNLGANEQVNLGNILVVRDQGTILPGTASRD